MEQINKFNLSKISQIDNDSQQKVTSRFNISAKTFAFFNKKIEELNKRAQKIGIPGIEYKVIGKKIVPPDANREKELMIYEIDVTGTVPKIAGWSFVASIHHGLDDAGQYSNIVSAIPSFEEQIPQRYWKQEPICEHCNTKRRRADTFILKNEKTDEFKQCGRNCLSDFLRTENVNDVINASALLSMHQELALMSSSEELDEYSGMNRGGGKRTYPLLNILALSNKIISQIGYIPSASEDSTSTKNIILTLISSERSFWKKILSKFSISTAETEAEDYEIADEAIQWIKGLSDSEISGNSYLSNIKALANTSFIEPRFMGLTVSVIPTYLRQRDRIRKEQTLKRIREEKGDTNPYLGKINEKIEFTVQIDKVKGPFKNGTSMLFIGTANEYKLVKWWGKPVDPFREKEIYKVVGIPISQAIDTYEKAEVTELTNVNIVSEDGTIEEDKTDTPFIGEIDQDGAGKMDNFEFTLIDKKGPFQGMSFDGRGRPTSYEIYIFQDSSGRKAKWSGPTGKYDMDIGGRYEIRAKPKTHDQNDRYEKGPVTILTQVRDVKELAISPEVIEQEKNRVMQLVQFPITEDQYKNEELKHKCVNKLNQLNGKYPELEKMLSEKISSIDQKMMELNEQAKLNTVMNSAFAQSLFMAHVVGKLGRALTDTETTYFNSFAFIFNDESRIATIEQQCIAMDKIQDKPTYITQTCEFFKVLASAARTFKDYVKTVYQQNQNR